MTTPRTTLPEPLEWEVLLTTLEGADHKIDRLLPLLELLNDPENPMSELGQALVDALHRIAIDLQEASDLRDAQRKALEATTSTNEALLRVMEVLSTDLQAIRQENRALTSKVNQIHGLMFSPED